MIKDYILNQRRKYKPAIFLFGLMPRSGTNYLNYLLSCCKDITQSKNEEEPWLMYIKFLVNYQDKINDFMIKRFKHDDMDSMNMVSLALNNKLCYLQEKNDNHIIFKHTNLINFEYFHYIFPHEKAIILLRNGRDIAYSLNKCEWGNRSIQEILLEYKFRKTRFNMITDKSNKNLYITNYEDLVRNPVKEIENILKQFNINSSIDKDKILDAPVIGSSQYKINGKINWKPIKKPDDFKPIGKGNEV